MMYCSRHCVRLALRAAVNTHRHSVQRTALYAQRTLKTSSVSAVDAIATPHLDGTPKEYSPKIQQLVNDIASLTLIEVSDLNELLKKTLNIQDVGMMSMGSMAAVPVAPPAELTEGLAEEEVAPAKKEKTHFTIKLTEFKAADKVKLIKEVKNCMEGINLVQAKKLVESLPQEIRTNISKDEAEKLKSALEAAGGTVVLE
ncbi:large ribosomal subunit protein bL12m isoform X1 [Danio rerio]|uniref:Large ribosomal subunit protein bL12m n=1 Tax=Danio rerio TaxID=7955 RepID=X1WHQ5_DANRE|nr:39S ribosomal protein L12, mitochondrial isoform X1 [Danio rerio]|eukprot:XP_009298024.1 39S ribosomal protein L12, mitochondrial isoform X1 [Danio rerio]